MHSSGDADWHQLQCCMKRCTIRDRCVFVCGFTDTTNQLVLLTNDPKKAEAPFTCVIHMYSHSMSCDALGPKYPNAHMGGFFEWGIPKLQ